jgi:hypothetical protein
MEANDVVVDVSGLPGSDALRAVLQALIDRHDELDRAEARLAAEWTAKGYTLVSVDGRPDGSWEVTDAQSGEVIATGRGGMNGLDRAASDKWINTDVLDDDAWDQVPDPTFLGLSPRLVADLQTLVSENQDDVRGLLKGW